MALKICTTGGNCITCRVSWDEFRKKYAEAKKKNQTFYCCGTKCVAIAHITTIVEVALGEEGEEGEEEDKGGGRSEEETEEITMF